MVLTKTSLILDTNSEAITPAVNIESLFFEKLRSNGDSTYTVTKESVALTSPIQVFMQDRTDITKLSYEKDSIEDKNYGLVGWDATFWLNNLSDEKKTINLYDKEFDTTDGFSHTENMKLQLFKLEESQYEDTTYKKLEIKKYFNFSDILTIFVTLHQLNTNILLKYYNATQKTIISKADEIKLVYDNFNDAESVLLDEADDLELNALDIMKLIIDKWQHVNVTYNTFKALVENFKLTPFTIYTFPYYSAYTGGTSLYTTNIPYYILNVIATGKNTYSSYAFITGYQAKSGITIDYGLWDAINFSKWKIKINTDINSFGIIYMKDEYDNEAPFDFKARKQSLTNAPLFSIKSVDATLYGLVRNCKIKTNSNHIYVSITKSSQTLSNLYIGRLVEDTSIIINKDGIYDNIYVGPNTSYATIINSYNISIGNSNDEIYITNSANMLIRSNNWDIHCVSCNNLKIDNGCQCIKCTSTNNINIGSYIYCNEGYQIISNCTNINISDSCYNVNISDSSNINLLSGNSDITIAGSDNITYMSGFKNKSISSQLNILEYDGKIVAPNYYVDNDLTITSFDCNNSEFDLCGEWDSTNDAYTFPITETINAYKILYSLNSNISNNKITVTKLQVYNASQTLSLEIGTSTSNSISINVGLSYTTFNTLRNSSGTKWTLRIDYTMNNIKFRKDVPILVSTYDE